LRFKQNKFVTIDESLTRETMRGFELGEKLPGAPDPAFFRVLKTLADTFLSVATRSNIRQPLMCFGVSVFRIERNRAFRC
jgi:hypothetical protein